MLPAVVPLGGYSSGRKREGRLTPQLSGRGCGGLGARFLLGRARRRGRGPCSVGSEARARVLPAPRRARPVTAPEGPPCKGRDHAGGPDQARIVTPDRSNLGPLQLVVRRPGLAMGAVLRAQRMFGRCRCRWISLTAGLCQSFVWDAVTAWDAVTGIGAGQRLNFLVELSAVGSCSPVGVDS